MVPLIITSFGTREISTVTSTAGYINEMHLFVASYEFRNVRGALSDLRQFLATESILKMKENSFYFTLKALFVLKIFKFLSSLFGQLENREYAREYAFHNNIHSSDTIQKY